MRRVLQQAKLDAQTRSRPRRPTGTTRRDSSKTTGGPSPFTAWLKTRGARRPPSSTTPRPCRSWCSVPAKDVRPTPHRRGVRATRVHESVLDRLRSRYAGFSAARATRFRPYATAASGRARLSPSLVARADHRGRRGLRRRASTGASRPTRAGETRHGSRTTGASPRRGPRERDDSVAPGVRRRRPRLSNGRDHHARLHLPPDGSRKARARAARAVVAPDKRLVVTLSRRFTVGQCRGDRRVDHRKGVLLHRACRRRGAAAGGVFLGAVLDQATRRRTALRPAPPRPAPPRPNSIFNGGGPRTP